MRHAIAVDVGGTRLRAAGVSADGQIVALRDCATLAKAGPEAVIGQILDLVNQVREACPDIGFEGIGLCAPGPLDPVAGISISPPTLEGWLDVPLAAIVAERSGLAAKLENDANAAALGEWRHGAGRGTRSMVYVTVSTGIGGGIIADGKLMHGLRGMAGEIGHMTIALGAARCVCGGDGCWEALASGPAFAAKAAALVASGKAPGLAAAASITPENIAMLARKGDRDALLLFSQEARWLGIGIANLLHLYAPERVIIGGGLGQCLDLMGEEIARTIAARAMAPYRDIKVAAAELRGNSGLVGAASLIFET